MLTLGEFLIFGTAIFLTGLIIGSETKGTSVEIFVPKRLRCANGIHDLKESPFCYGCECATCGERFYDSDYYAETFPEEGWYVE